MNESRNKTPIYALFFGSLRKNSKRGYNFDRMGKGTQKHLADYTLSGYEMYDCGAYPTICKGEGEIKTELHEITTEEAFKNIGRIELGAGYTPEQITVEYQGKPVKATMYFWDKKQIEKYKLPKVESGDWN